ncbi:MAG: single-stranded DNA-binding protein [Candidatus Nealsonbacteria bacterium]|nr:single-stranded DNA-binding protein [Candidatus Nealsonbacteria bacterium]
MNLNKIFLIGRLTRDPQIKSLPSGQQVSTFGLATDRFFNDKSGQKQQKVEFHNIVLFGRLAEIASQYLTKGGLVFIEGRIQTRSWQDSSGNQRTRTEVVAERIQLGPRTALKQMPEKEIVDEDKSSSPPLATAQEVEEDKSSSPPLAKAQVVDEDKSSSPPFAAAQVKEEEIPIIEEDEIDVKDIPF